MSFSSGGAKRGPNFGKSLFGRFGDFGRPVCGTNEARRPNAVGLFSVGTPRAKSFLRERRLLREFLERRCKKGSEFRKIAVWQIWRLWAASVRNQ